MMERCRLRETGLTVGNLPTGPLNSLTDVAGVRVGHTTLISGSGAWIPGQGPVRTGVTVILPHGGNLFTEKSPAAVATINGFGKPLGFEQVRELGWLESPIALTNTLNVGRVADALVTDFLEKNPQGVSVNVVVGETNDSDLNDIQGRHVQAEHVRAALQQASTDLVPEGCVGAGTGTVCFGWKGGIGSASRVIPASLGGYTVGALVQTNFGASEDLIVCGVPVGRQLQPSKSITRAQEKGSIMVVLATDAPLLSRALERLALRAAAGIARTGGVYGHSSGDFVIAFSTANRLLVKPGELTQTLQVLRMEGAVMNALFHAAAESVEEAILNSLFMAVDLDGRDGHIRRALPLDTLLKLIQP
jgi:D-aminopeptidase